MHDEVGDPATMTVGMPAAAGERRFARAADRVIIGLAVGYGFEALSPFIRSLAATGYRGALVLYVSDLPRECILQLRAYGIELRQAAPFLCAEMDPQLARYGMYLDCLAGWPVRLRFAMISDIRDVVFQSDPSDFPALSAAGGPSLHTWQESDGTDLGAEPTNKAWLTTLYGATASRLLTGQPVSCSGISMGDHAGMLGYIARMQEEVRRQRGGLRLKGIDQGIHNHLVWAQRPPGTEVHANGTHVLTLGISRREAFSVAGERILLPDGRAPAVVHQWDRHPDLVTLVERLHGASGRPAPMLRGQAEPAPLILGWVSASATPGSVETFLASALDAGLDAEIRLLGPGAAAGPIADIAAAMLAGLPEPDLAAAALGFHPAMAAALAGEPDGRPVMCLDAGSALLLDDPFRCRIAEQPLVAMEGGGRTIGSYATWRRRINTFAGEATLAAVGGRVPVAPYFMLGRAAGLRGLLDRIATLRAAHAGEADFALVQVAALDGVSPFAETMPNFGIVANMVGFDDTIVAFDGVPRFHNRVCAVVLHPERSEKLKAWAALLRTRLGLSG